MLNEEQKNLVEKNHNLIYYVLLKHELSINEHYDIAAIALCNAAKKYNEKRGSFTTFAVHCIEMQLRCEHRKATNKKRSTSAGTVSMDADMTGDGCNIGLFIGKSYIDDDLILMDVRSLLNEQQRTIFEYLLLGYTQCEIAKILNISQPVISRKITKIRQIIKKELCLE